MEHILLQRHERLLDLNDALLRYLLKKFKIDCKITYTDTFTSPTVPPSPTDLRTLLTDKHTLPHPTSFDAPAVPSLEGVREAGGYVPKSSHPTTPPLFNSQFSIHNSQFPSYPQVFDTRLGFLPNLSAIDLLFNLGPEAKPLLLQTAPILQS
ncbi:MAG: WbqC family protein [Bacteroidales bacterium]|nr:WbqC family protein [Bacteroidales bacterium]